jgi:hypothetical protein
MTSKSVPFKEVIGAKNVPKAEFDGNIWQTRECNSPPGMGLADRESFRMAMKVTRRIAGSVNESYQVVSRRPGVRQQQLMVRSGSLRNSGASALAAPPFH